MLTLYLAAYLAAWVIHHVGKCMKKEFFPRQPPQDRQLCAGNFGVTIVLVNIPAGLHQAVNGAIHVAIVGKTIQRVLRTVKAVAGAVCLRGDILSHDEPIATAGEIRLKAFISVHQAASPKEERSPSEICPSSASAFFGGSFFSGSFFFSSFFFLETDLEDVFPR